MVCAQTTKWMLLLPLWIGVVLAQSSATHNIEVGSQACAQCHREIYRKYSATGMARSSGNISQSEFRESLREAAFSDPITGAVYRVSKTHDGYSLEFARDTSGVKGERRLQWFIGSGRVGRSYLFSLDGFLFQSPLSYYSLAQKWGLSPGFDGYRSIYLTRAIGTGCLQCHAGRLKPVAGFQNQFESVPFLDAGVGCERCHGPGSGHVAKMTSAKHSGGADIVNPAELDAARRDSVCAQCHLNGAARIARIRATGGEYRPGELLSDYSAFFVWTVADSTILSANSHFEKLQQSRCKRISGDRLWCGSCHDPHSEPEPAKRVAFYRSACQKCHQDSACKESLEVRRQSQDDCIACHMPKAPVRDIEHEVFTDHSIPRRTPRAASHDAVDRSLKSFWQTPVDERDLALALASVAGKDAGLRRQAFDRLRKAETRRPNDVPVLVQLAQVYDQLGNDGIAQALSERVLSLDPTQVSVMINLGGYYMKQGRTKEAMRLWSDAIARAPGLTSGRINLAVAQYRAGDRAVADATLRKALEYDPDDGTARQLLSEIQGAGH